MMNAEQFNQAVLDKIAEERIKPRPKWWFVWRNLAIWTMGVLALALGALSVSLIIYMQGLGEWSVYRSMQVGYMEMMLVMVPVFWFVTLGLFILALYYNVKKTDQGYRYRPSYVLVIAILASLLLGLLLHAGGVSAWLDEVLSERAPYYENVLSPAVSYWSEPQDGRLIGVVSSQLYGDQFFLISPEAQEWQVLWKSNDGPKPVVFPGLVVRCLGRQIDDGKFLAERIWAVVPGAKFIKSRRSGCTAMHQAKWQHISCKKVLFERFGIGIMHR